MKKGNYRAFREYMKAGRKSKHSGKLILFGRTFIVQEGHAMDEKELLSPYGGGVKNRYAYIHACATIARNESAEEKHAQYLDAKRAYTTWARIK